MLWALAELYTNMDVALIAELIADVVLEKILQAPEWKNPADHPGILSRGWSPFLVIVPDTHKYYLQNCIRK